MMLLKYEDTDAFGSVKSVDTTTVIVTVKQVETLRTLQVNRLVALQSSRAGQHLIGVISRISRTSIDERKRPGDLEDAEEAIDEINVVRISLIGTVVDLPGSEASMFRRTLESVPEIDANCFSLEGDMLTKFMQVISLVSGDSQRLSLGQYTLDVNAEAFINGNKLFQRHSLIAGSTGSGKSWTVARLLEQIAQLRSANAIVFDIHGEYNSLSGDEFDHLKVAGPSDVDAKRGLADGSLYLPYWLMSYDAMISIFVDRSDTNAPNQSMIMSRAIFEAKHAALSLNNKSEILQNFTIDSPVPFDIELVRKIIEEKNTEMIPGARTEKQGDFHGKLSRMLQRLESKMQDRRLGFLFPKIDEVSRFDWLIQLVNRLLGSRSSKRGTGGVKIIDFSEVPSDILPLIVGMVGRLVFSVQQWMPSEVRHPVALFCDEAHLYVPDEKRSVSAENASEVFERIAKEGRKYGVGLVVVSQRPSEVNRTIVSQCSNLIAIRLTNGEDQSVVKRLLPDSLFGFGEILPILDTGEALVVGDAALLPTRVRISPPKN